MTLHKSECAIYKHSIKKHIEKTEDTLKETGEEEQNQIIRINSYDLIDMENIAEREYVVIEFDFFNKYIKKVDGLLLLINIRSINDNFGQVGDHY